MTTISYEDFSPEVQTLMARLNAIGFTIVESGVGRPVTTGSRTTRRVMWRGIHVARLEQKDGAGKARGILGYRFGAETGDTTAPCPLALLDVTTVSRDEAIAIGERFKNTFAEENGCDLETIFVWPESEKGEWRWYLSIGDIETAVRVMEASAALIDASHLAAELTTDAASAGEDVADINGRVSDATLRKALVDARLGQGGFRNALIRAFSGRCAVSGLAIEQALIASHIVAWSDPSTNDVERLDPQNGLLLAANIDALFDRHLISFAHDGTVMLSTFLSGNEMERIGIFRRLVTVPDSRRAGYLERHRTRFRCLELTRAELMRKREEAER